MVEGSRHLAEDSDALEILVVELAVCTEEGSCTHVLRLLVIGSWGRKDEEGCGVRGNGALSQDGDTGAGE